MKKCYITLDGGVQYFYHLVKEEGKYFKVTEIAMNVATTQFGQNIFSRETLGERKFPTEYGSIHDGTAWSISEKEFDRLQKLNTLLASHLEYERLAKYE